MLARSVTLNVAGQIASLVVGFVGSILLARWLGAADRGLLGIMLSAGNLALAASGIGIPAAVTYFASRRDAPQGALLGNSIVYAFLLAAVFVPTTWFLAGPISDLLARGRGGQTWALAAVLVPLTFLDWTTHNQLLGQLRFGLYNALVATSKLAYVACLAALVGALDTGITGALVASIVAAQLMTLGSLPVILRTGGRPRLDLGVFWQTVRYGSRVQIGTLFQILNFRLDVIILQFFRPLSQVGYYVVAQVIAELVLTFARAFQSSVLPLVSRYEGDNRQATTTIRSTRHHGVVALAAIVANAGFGPLVIYYAYGPEFRPAIVPMLILLPAMWFLGTGTVIGSDLGGRGRPGLSSALAGLAVAFTVVLDVLLIPPLGVPGAALASMIAYSVFGVASLLALARVSEIPLRELVVPTRDDLVTYPRAARAALGRLRRAAPGRR